MSVLQSWIEVVVSARHAEATDVVVLELVDPNQRTLPAFSAGSHIDVEVAPGLVRQYSLCNTPLERDRYVIGVLLEPSSRGGSKAIHENFNEGARLRISDPRNHFGLEVGARKSYLFAGGIGITPILCMAERLHHTGADFELHYCVRSPDRAAFRERIGSSPYSSRVAIHFDNGPDEQKLDPVRVLANPNGDDHIYVCGPAGFIDWILTTAREAGWKEANLHREYFVAPEHDVADSQSFEVTLASDGRSFLIPPDRTVVEVLADHGIEIPTSCAQGVCGTCVTGILSGVPEHQDYFLSDEEKAANNCFTPCCSRAKTSTLVLDL